MSEKAKELCQQGNLAASKGNHPLALSLWQQAVALDPTFVAAWQNQIAILRQSGNLQQALKVADAALQQLSEKPELYYNRANLHSSLTNYRQAIEDYSSTIRFVPDHGQAYANRGLMYLREKALKEAQADFDQALTLNPKDSVAHYHRATIRMNQEDLEGALQDLTDVIEHDSIPARLALAYTQRSAIWSRQGKLEKAILDVDSALRVDPNPKNKTELEELLVRYRTLHQQQVVSQPPPPTGTQSLALPYKELFQETKKKRHDTTGMFITSEGFIRHAKEHLENLAFTEGFTAIHKALQLDPQSADAYAVRGALYLMNHETAKAKQDLDRALEIDPRQVSVLANRAIWFVLHQQAAEAIADLQNAYAINPSVSLLHSGWGSYYETLQLRTQALAAHHYATVLDANNAQAYNNVGRLYLAVGLVDKAYPYIAHTLELQPNNVRAWMNAGSICLAKNEVEEALSFLERAVQSGYELAKPALAEARRRAANPSIQAPAPTAEELKQQQLFNFAYELAKFAYRHSGPDRWQQNVDKKGWFGLGARTVVETTQRWGISIEEMAAIGQNGYAGPQSVASLALVQEPVVEIRVGSNASGMAQLTILSEAWIRGSNAMQANLSKIVKNTLVMASEDLAQELQKLLDREILTLQEGKLYYTGKTIH